MHQEKILRAIQLSKSRQDQKNKYLFQVPAGTIDSAAKKVSVVNLDLNQNHHHIEPHQ